MKVLIIVGVVLTIVAMVIDLSNGLYEMAFLRFALMLSQLAILIKLIQETK